MKISQVRDREPPETVELGYEVIGLPKVGVSERANFILHTLLEELSAATRKISLRGANRS